MKIKSTLLFVFIAFYGISYGQAFKNPALPTPSSNKVMPPKIKPKPTGNAKQMDAVAVAVNGYLPGATQNIYFQIDVVNADLEFGDSLALTFPTGININSVSNDEAFEGGADNGGGYQELFNGINGPTISWGDNDNIYGGISTSATYTFSVNLTFDGSLSGDQTISGYLSGDTYGADPGDLNFSILLSEASSPNVEIQVIHNVADPAAAAIDVRVDGTIANAGLDDITFRTSTEFFEVSALTPHNFSVNPASSTDDSGALYTQSVSFDPGVDYIVIIDGTASATGYDPVTPLSFEAFPQAMHAASAGDEVAVVFHNGATDSPGLDFEQAGTFMPAASNLAYGDFGGYTAFPATDFYINVNDADQYQLIHTYEANFGSLSLGGQALTIFTSGFLDALANSDGVPMELWAAPANGGALFALEQYLVPNDTPCEAFVIDVDGAAVTGANIGAGIDESEVVPPNGDCSGNLSWCDGNFDSEFASIDATVWLAFVAPESGGVEVNTCDSSTYLDTQIAIYSATDCADYSTYSLLAANDDFDSGSSCNANTFFASRVSTCGLTPGDTYYIQLDGYAGSTGTYGVRVSSLEETACSARLQIVNNSADPALQNVDIRINGELIAADYDDLEFRYATATLQMPVGVPLTITVNDVSSTDDSNPILIEDSVVLQPGMGYQAILQGLISETGYSPGADAAPLTWNIIEGFLETNPAPDGTYLALANGVTDSPAIDIEKQYGGTGTVVSNLPYSGVDGYFEELAVNTTWAVYESGSTEIYGSFNAAFEDFGLGGMATTVLASGFYDPSQNSDGAQFGLFASKPSGGMLIALNTVTATDNVDAAARFVVYPNPANDKLTIDMDLKDARDLAVSLFNVVGQNVKHINFGMQARGFNTTTISLNDLPAGFYLMDLTIGGSHSTTKIQVVR